jgi:hypothetical protein
MEFPIPPLDGFCFWRPWMQHGSCFNHHSCCVLHSCSCGRLPTRCLATFASSHILGFWKASVFGSQPLTIYHLILSYTPSARTPDLLQECCNGKRSQRSFPPSRICHSSTAAIDASVPRKWAKAAYLQSGGADTQNIA